MLEYEWCEGYGLGSKSTPRRHSRHICHNYNEIDACAPLQTPDAPRAQRLNPLEYSIKVMTIHTSKVQEFPVVRGTVQRGAEDTVKEDSRLLYVVATRATYSILLKLD